MPTATLVRLDPELSAEVLRWLPKALAGDRRAARRYARTWRALVRALCAERPDVPPSAVDVLEHLASTAPFVPEGPLRALASVAAGIMPGMGAVPTPRVDRSELPGPAEYRRFVRVVLDELGDPGSGIERLMTAWELSVTDVARLFGVSRQAVQQWLEEGVPGARRPKLLAILGIVELLQRNVLPSRIPGIVRAPAEAYGGRSMLEAIADDRHQEVLEGARRSFDWAWTA